MDWPKAWCDLRLLSHGGHVFYEFDTDDVIPLSDFLKNHKHYRPESLQ